MAKKAVKKELVKLPLKSVGRVFQSEGATFEEAVDKIKISGGARAISVLKLEQNGKETVKILNARYTNGLFGCTLSFTQFSINSIGNEGVLFA